MYDESFKKMTITKGKLRATWEYIGEGCWGDYNPENHRDIPLLRFNCELRHRGRWEQVEGASYCTTVPINAKRSELRKMLRTILKEKELIDTYPERRHPMQEMSWIGERKAG